MARRRFAAAARLWHFSRDGWIAALRRGQVFQQRRQPRLLRADANWREGARCRQYYDAQFPASRRFTEDDAARGLGLVSSIILLACHARSEWHGPQTMPMAAARSR